MQTGQAKFGMQTLNQSLYDLYVKKSISTRIVWQVSNVEELIQMLADRACGLANGSEGLPVTHACGLSDP